MVQKDYHEDHFEDANASEEEIFSRPGWAREMPYWTISAVLHIFVILIIGGFILSRKVIEADKNIDLVTRLKDNPPKYDPEKTRALERKPEILKQQIIKDPVITRLPEEIAAEVTGGRDE